MLNEYIKACSSLNPSLIFKLSVNGIEVTVGNEEHFLNSVIRRGLRLTAGNPITRVELVMTVNGQQVVYGIIMEFPSCCGKAIFHGFKLLSSTYEFGPDGKATGKRIELEKEVIKDIWLNMLTLVKRICNHTGYTSISFIVSRGEQFNIQNIMDCTQVKLINQFSNKRGSRNECNEYVLPVDDNKVV